MISSGPYTREARSFEKAEEYEPDTLERIRKTYTPRVDGDYVEWEIKTPAQSHLSTTIYIERTYTLHPKQLRYAIGDDEEKNDGTATRGTDDDPHGAATAIATARAP